MKRNFIVLIALLILIVAGFVSYNFFYLESQPEATFEGKGGKFRGHGASGSW